MNKVSEDLSLLLGLKVPASQWVRFADVLNPTGRPDRITLIKMVLCLAEHIDQLENKEPEMTITRSSNQEESKVYVGLETLHTSEDPKEALRLRRIENLQKAREARRVKNKVTVQPAQE